MMQIDILNATELPPSMPGAVCSETDPELFHPATAGGMGEARRAKTLCGLCDWRSKCLEFALETGQQYGIWGGLTARERQKLRRVA